MDDLFDGLRAAPAAPGVAAPGGAVAGQDPAVKARELLAHAHTTLDELMATMALLGERPEELGTPFLEWLVKEVQTLGNRHDRLRVRALDVVRVTREVGNAHHKNDAQFTAGRTRTRRHQAGRDADLAKALGNHTPTPPPGPGSDGAGGAGGPSGPGSDGPGLLNGGHSSGSPTSGLVQTPTAAAWDAGLITRDHALIITRALNDLPDHLTTEQRHTVEVDLVAKAKQMNPTRLGKAAKRALEALNLPVEEVDAHHNELVHAEETAAWDAASFWMKDNRDGTWFGQFTLPALQAQMLKKALDSMTSPRRHNKGQAGSSHATGGVGGGEAFGPTSSQTATGSAWTGDVRFDRELRDQQRGQALAEFIDHLPTDHLHPKINTILLVTTDLDTLRGQTDRVGVTDTGDDVSAGQVRRLASNAALIPIVMNGASVPLDLGRKRRSFTESQKAALATKYSECAEEDCDRPFAWCEIHHADPWRPVYAPDGTLLHPGGGRTDLSNGIPLCGRHHRQMDDPRLKHTITYDAKGRATIRFTWRRPGEPWKHTKYAHNPTAPGDPTGAPSPAPAAQPSGAVPTTSCSGPPERPSPSSEITSSSSVARQDGPL
ncbi:DUF222 domain-containing protein [Kytococcus sedentarius]|uniref:HNH endonuclease signature motif containing protein n=1 Tax=Kytococcus sedentarius TaxID=1276 RepID=UPI0035BBE26E